MFGGLLVAICALQSILVVAAGPGWPTPGQPHTVPDEVFLQEIGRKVPTTFALVALAIYDG